MVADSGAQGTEVYVGMVRRGISASHDHVRSVGFRPKNARIHERCALIRSWRSFDRSDAPADRRSKWTDGLSAGEAAARIETARVLAFRLRYGSYVWFSSKRESNLAGARNPCILPTLTTGVQ